jgi:hypothetical protein
MVSMVAAIQSFLAEGRLIHTRVRERSTGDIHDVPAIPPALPGLAGYSQEVVAILEGLERQGHVARYEVVYAYDTTEFYVIWCLVGS